jgi:hypothetical protein
MHRDQPFQEGGTPPRSGRHSEDSCGAGPYPVSPPGAATRPRSSSQPPCALVCGSFPAPFSMPPAPPSWIAAHTVPGPLSIAPRWRNRTSLSTARQLHQDERSSAQERARRSFAPLSASHRRGPRRGWGTEGRRSVAGSTVLVRLTRVSGTSPRPRTYILQGAHFVPTQGRTGVECQLGGAICRIPTSCDGVGSAQRLCDCVACPTVTGKFGQDTVLTDGRARCRHSDDQEVVLARRARRRRRWREARRL